MLKALQLEPEKCTGCLQCEMACSYENEGVFNPSKSRIKVFNFHDEGRFAPYTCSQCSEAWCLHACPVEAIVINAQTGAKEVIEDVCVGCKVCTPSARSTTTWTAARSSSATSAVETPLARRPVRPARSPTSMPRTPGSRA